MAKTSQPTVTLKHLAAALAGAQQRPLGDAWAWSRKSSRVNIAPLIAATLALSSAIDSPAGEPVIYW